MKALSGNLGARRLGVPAIVVLCLALLALISVVQVTHLHQTTSEADHCALCLVMHTTAPLPLAVGAVMVFVQLGFSAPVLRVRPVIRYWHPQLFTRPPPQNS